MLVGLLMVKFQNLVLFFEVVVGIFIVIICVELQDDLLLFLLLLLVRFVGLDMLNFLVSGLCDMVLMWINLVIGELLKLCIVR